MILRDIWQNTRDFTFATIGIGEQRYDRFYAKTIYKFLISLHTHTHTVSGSWILRFYSYVPNCVQQWITTLFPCADSIGMQYLSLLPWVLVGLGLAPMEYEQKQHCVPSEPRLQEAWLLPLSFWDPWVAGKRGPESLGFPVLLTRELCCRGLLNPVALWRNELHRTHQTIHGVELPSGGQLTQRIISKSFFSH